MRLSWRFGTYVLPSTSGIVVSARALSTTVLESLHGASALSGSVSFSHLTTVHSATAAVSPGSSGCVHMRITVGAASTSATSQVTTTAVTANALHASPQERPE